MSEANVMLDSNLVRGAPDQDPVEAVLRAVGALVVRTATARYRLSRVVVQHSVTPGCVVNVYAADGIPEVGLQAVQIRPDGKSELFPTDSAGHTQFNWGRESAFSDFGAGPMMVSLVEGAKLGDDHRLSQFTLVSDVVKSLGDYQGEHIQVYLQFVEAGAAPAPVPGKLDLRGVINALAQMHDAQASAMDALIGELEKINKAAAL